MRELTHDETMAVSGGGLFSFIVGAFKITFGILKPIETIKSIFRAIFGSGGGASEPVATTSHRSVMIEDFDFDGSGDYDSDERFHYRQAINYNPNAQIP